MKRNGINAALAASAFLLAASQAEAATYMITYSTPSGPFSGTITTTNTPDVNGFVLITGLTGTHGADAVTLIAPGAFPAAAAPNDNLFRPTPAYLDGNGFSYSAGGFNYNVYFSSNAYQECSDNTAACNNNGRYYTIANFTVTNGVPEPAAWAMMIAGFALAGGAIRRSRATRVSFA